MAKVNPNTLKGRYKHRYYTKNEWETNNPVLLRGELGFVIDDDGKMKIGDGTTVWNNLPYFFHESDITPIIEKTYENVYCTENSNPVAWLYFGTIVPDSYTKLWCIKYKVYGEAKGTEHVNTSIVELYGYGSIVVTQKIYNNITSIDYRIYYNHLIYRATETGVENGYGHALGIRFQSSWNPHLEENSRTIKIELMYIDNASLSLFDNMLLYANIPGTGTVNYVGLTEINGTTNGITVSGDRNDNDLENIKLYGANPIAGTSGIHPYSLFMMDENGTYQSFTTNTGTGTTKTKNTVGFILGQIYYNNANTNYTNGNAMADNTVFRFRSNIDLRYSTNCGKTLVANKMVYIVGTLKNGLFYLDNEWCTQTPPATVDGKIYIPIGFMRSSYQIDFTGYMDYYFYNGRKFVASELPPLTEEFTGTGTRTLISANGSELKWRGVRSTKNITADDSGSTSLIDAGSVYSSLSSQVITEEYNPSASETVTANWDFKNNNPSTMSSVNIQGTNATGTVLSDVSADNDDLKLTVNAAVSGTNVKLQYNSNGYAQFNTNTRIQVPVRTNTDVITVVSYNGQHNYTVGGTAAASDTVNYSVTSTDVAAGHVDIIATNTSYLYSIKLITVAIGDNWFDLTFLKSTSGLLRLLHKNNFQINQSATETKLKLAGNGDKGILRLYNGNYYGDLQSGTLSTNRTWTLPDSSGTIATQDYATNYVNNYVKNGVLTLKVGTTQIGTFTANQAANSTWTITKTNITNLGIEATDENVKFNSAFNGWYKIPIVKNVLTNNEITTLLFNDNDSLCTYTGSDATYIQLGDCIPAFDPDSETSGSTSRHKGILRIYNGCYVDFSANTLTENQYAYFPNHSGTLVMIDSWTNNVTSEDVGAYLSATIKINGVNKYIYAKAGGAITEEYNSATGSTRTLAFVNQDGNNPQNILFNRGLTIQIKDGKVENNTNIAGTAYLYLGKADATNGHQEGQFRLFSTNGYYANVRTLNLTSDVALSLPNKTGTIALVDSDIVAIASFPGSKNLNDIAKYGNAVGYATNVTSTDSTVNPSGTVAADDYTFLNMSYKITGQSNYYITQIVNKAGTTDLWVRSRNGGAITNGTAWAAPWTRILTSNDITATSPIEVSKDATTQKLSVSHANSGATAGNYGDNAAQTPAYGGTFNVPYIEVNSTGHITKISSHTVKIPASDNTTGTNIQATNTTNADYRLLLSTIADDNAETNKEPIKANGLYYNNSTKSLTLDGWVITKNTTTGALEFSI